MFSVLVSLFGSRALFKIRLLATLLVLAFAITLAPSVAYAANPQVPQGYGNSFPADSHDSPSTAFAHGPYYAEWDIINAAGTVVATLDNPNGWGASETSGTVYVRTPASALLASNYEVRYSEAGTYGAGYGASYSGHFDVVAASNAPFTVTLNPQTVSGGSPCTGKITLTNPAPSGGTTVTLSTNDGTVTVPARVTVNAQSTTATFPVTTQANNGSYTVGIYATFSSGVYQKVLLNITAAPPAPTSVTASPGDKQVSLSWTASSGFSVTGYNVYRSTTSGSGYVQVNPSSVSGTTYTDPGLTDGTTYYYVVTAISSQGESSYSNEASATLTAPAALAAPGNISVISTGSGKITLYWDDALDANGSTHAIGYNIYRSMTAGGEDYNNHVNVGGPVTTLSYSGGSTFTFTDRGLSNNVQYFYTVRAVYSAGESQPSNEDSDIVDSQAVPWDTRDPNQILSALQALSDETVDGPLRAMGPDGEIYQTGVSAAQQPDGTPSVDSNVWDLRDGTTLVVPDDNLDANGGPPSSTASGSSNYIPPAPSHHTGPLREVISQPGYRKAYGTFILPSSIGITPYTYPSAYTRKKYDKATNQYTMVPIGNTADAPYILLGSFGNNLGASKANVDAGLLFQGGVWRPYMRSSLQKDPINVATASDPTPPVSFPSGDQVDIIYYIQTPTVVGKSKVNVFCKITSELTGDSMTRSAFVDHHPADGTGVSIKREHSIAQNLAVDNGDRANGFRRTGSHVDGATWSNGHLVSNSGTSIWGPKPAFTAVSDLFGPVTYGSQASTPFSYEPSINIDL